MYMVLQIFVVGLRILWALKVKTHVSFIQLCTLRRNLYQ